MNAVTTLPVRGQSVAELHGYFNLARSDRSKGELFAMRVMRAEASGADEILLKLEAAEWLGQDPLQILSIIRDDLIRLKAKP
jgi:hypothetical protein